MIILAFEDAATIQSELVVSETLHLRGSIVLIGYHERHGEVLLSVSACDDSFMTELS